MTENENPELAALVDAIASKAGSGTDVLAKLDPQIPWVKLSTLVDTAIIVVDFEERVGMDGEPAFVCRLITEDAQMVRGTFGGKAVMHKLEVCKDRLPLKFNLLKKKSKDGLQYFDLE
jgi:hypothetical protein